MDKVELHLRQEIGELKQDNLQLAYALRQLVASFARTGEDQQMAIEAAVLLLARLEARNQ